MMRYFKMWVDTPYCGTYDCQLFALDEKESIEDLKIEEENFAENYFDSYSYLAEEEVCEEDYDTFEDFEVGLVEAIEEYWSSCSSGLEEITYEEFIELGGDPNER